jgi:hypothetical protein
MRQKSNENVPQMNREIPQEAGHFALPFAVFLVAFSAVSFFLMPQIVWFYSVVLGNDNLYQFVCKTPSPF